MVTRNVTIGAAAIAVSLCIVGCGESSRDAGSGLITPAAVIEQVQKATGKRLVPGDETTSTWHVLDLGPRIGRDCNGCFWVIVPDLGWGVAWYLFEGSRVDGRGIYWQRLGGRAPYEAMTLYGYHVFLFWSSSRVGRIDATWTRLDRYLSRLGPRSMCRHCLRALSSGAGLWSAGKKPRFRRSLETRKEKQEYDDAFYACSPEIPADELHENLSRQERVRDIAGIYSGGDTRPTVIANGVAKAYTRIADRQFEHTARAREIWRRACLDALTGS